MPTVFFLGCVLCVFPVALPAAALRLTDDAGVMLQFEQPAQRVISLSPHLTEMMYAIGAGKLLAGVVRGGDFPAEAAALPQMGDSAGLDFERIVHSRADAVLVWGSGNRSVDIERLRTLGQAVVALEARRLSDIPRHLLLLGALTGRDQYAQAVVRQFETRLAALHQRYAAGTGLRVLFEIWHRPLLTVNGDHIISKLLELCGAQNIFAGLPRLAGEISLEQVLLSDPDAIVVGSEAADAGIANWLAFPYLKAVRTGNVFTVPADEITRQTPRLLDAAEKLCRSLEQARN